MLRDSLLPEGAGRHVEQVEIVFAGEISSDRVIPAWRETVARTEALRINFATGAGETALLGPIDFLRIEEVLPDSWPSWLDADRMRPLLIPDDVPWRAVYWPLSGHLIWTFHHALLDGRSVARVLRGFLERVAGGTAEDLALAKWSEPTPAALALAQDIFRESFVDLEPSEFASNTETSSAGQALCCLGNDFAARLEMMATTMDLTTATLLTWAWGQALAEASNADAVMVEQVRAGIPQHGTAGFTMITLPIMIHRTGGASVRENLREFRTHLLALRAIETVSPSDFPPGIFPDMDRPGGSVIMVEHGTLRQMTGKVAQEKWIESLVLHEAKGESLTATAHILPDLQLEVEGPGRHRLLVKWAGVLKKLLSPGRELQP